MTIKITNDFGHGGTDPGAVSIVVEKDGVLRCGKSLTESLLRNNFAVKETRSSDTFVSLSDRVRISDTFGSDWFISNHEDAGGGHGITVYCYKFGGKGEILAKEVLKELIAATGMPSRGVKEGNFQVIRETDCPAILIEFGFVDNAEDATVIKREDIPNIYGDAVTKALCSVCNIAFIPKTQSQPTPQPEPINPTPPQPIPPSPQPIPQPKPIPAPKVITKFTYPNNAKCVNDDLYIRDVNGNRLEGRYVAKGDNITVLEINSAKQLVLVQYPTSNGVRSGWVKNVSSCIQYYYQEQWHNGSTPEPTLDDKGNKIGSLNPRETATPLYRRNGKLKVVYDTSVGRNSKAGYVAYNGGFNKF